MTRLIAAVDTGPLRAVVISTAEALVPLMADRVEVVTIDVDSTDPDDTTGRQLVSITDDEDVAGIVVGLRSVAGGPRPAGHVAELVMTKSDVPVIAVPPETDRTEDPLARVLLPLEGRPDGDDPTGALATGLARLGSTVDTIHVFDRANMPMFWDGWDEHDIFADQFSSRFSPVDEPTELRVGGVAQQILSDAAAKGSTMIVLQWKRDLSGAHAPVVRDLLCNTTVPLLLTPVTEQGEEVR